MSTVQPVPDPAADALHRPCAVCGRSMPLDDEEPGEVVAHARAAAHGNYSVLCEDSQRVTKARMKRLGILTEIERHIAMAPTWVTK